MITIGLPLVPAIPAAASAASAGRPDGWGGPGGEQGQGFLGLLAGLISDAGLAQGTETRPAGLGADSPGVEIGLGLALGLALGEETAPEIEDAVSGPPAAPAPTSPLDILPFALLTAGEIGVGGGLAPTVADSSPGAPVPSSGVGTIGAVGGQGTVPTGASPAGPTAAPAQGTWPASSPLGFRQVVPADAQPGADLAVPAEPAGAAGKPGIQAGPAAQGTSGETPATQGTSGGTPGTQGTSGGTPAVPGSQGTAATPQGNSELSPVIPPGVIPVPDPARATPEGTTSTAQDGAGAGQTDAAGQGAALAPSPAIAGANAPPTADALPEPLAPASQVAVHLIPLRRGPDGTHRLTAHLHPEDLGQITVIAEVRRGEITVQLAGSTEAGRLALAAGLPELRQEMINSGFGSCSLELVADSAGDQTGQRQALADQSGPDRRPAPDARSEDDHSSQRNGPTGGDQDPATTTSGDDRAPRRGIDLHV